jgi:hypothetical protein
MSSKPSTTETTTDVKVIRVADLTTAQRKALVALFGALPEGNAVTLQARKGNPKTQVNCECGCGEVAKSLFIAGHDAKMKSLLNSVANGTETTQINHLQFSKATATAELAKRGW